MALNQMLTSDGQLNKTVDISSYSGPDILLGHYMAQHAWVPLNNCRIGLVS